MSRALTITWYTFFSSRALSITWYALFLGLRASCEVGAQHVGLHLLLHPPQRHQGQRLHCPGDVRLQAGECPQWLVYQLVSAHSDWSFSWWVPAVTGLSAGECPQWLVYQLVSAGSNSSGMPSHSGVFFFFFPSSLLSFFSSFLLLLLLQILYWPSNWSSAVVAAKCFQARKHCFHPGSLNVCVDVLRL